MNTVVSPVQGLSDKKVKELAGQYKIAGRSKMTVKELKDELEARFLSSEDYITLQKQREDVETRKRLAEQKRAEDAISNRNERLKQNNSTEAYEKLERIRSSLLSIVVQQEHAPDVPKIVLHMKELTNMFESIDSITLMGMNITIMMGMIDFVAHFQRSIANGDVKFKEP